MHFILATITLKTGSIKRLNNSISSAKNNVKVAIFKSNSSIHVDVASKELPGTTSTNDMRKLLNEISFVITLNAYSTLMNTTKKFFQIK